MAASGAKKGFGAKLQVQSVTPGTYTDVKESSVIPQIGGTRETADVTHYESDGGYHEYITTLRDSMELAVESNYLATDAGQDRIKTLFDSGALESYKLIGPTTTTSETITFNALVTSYSVEYEKAGSVRLRFTLKITGDQTTGATS